MKQALLHPTKIKQFVKFHTPNPDEDANQVYEVTELNGNRCLITAINTGLSISPQQTVLVQDLEVIEIPSLDLKREAYFIMCDIHDLKIKISKKELRKKDISQEIIKLTELRKKLYNVGEKLEVFDKEQARIVKTSAEGKYTNS